MTTDADLRLPKRTRDAVAHVPVDKRHPGLQLDKFSPPGNQEAQKRAMEKVLACPGDDALLKGLRARRCETLTRLSARVWTATTAAPLTLHLSCAAALENAGICLHPLYGFVYLPGSGLKGMARAYAETVWLAAKSVENRATAQTHIERVFGIAPKGKSAGAAGTVVFHDAWPETWPTLIVDIVNNHHTKYYRGEDAPGDWEDPVPSYFLAVKAGAAFSFALSPRRDEDADLGLAREWLTGALCHLGAGAKTAAGNGGFRPVDDPAPASPKDVIGDEETWAEWSGTLELVTPAFLAGASQQAEDCDLRPATLRGQLRWWWRTMHAAHLEVDELRKLEAAVWGSTEVGSPVRIEVSRMVESDPEPCPAVGSGVSCLCYGMRENQRLFVAAGASWEVHLTARAGRYPLAANANAKHISVSAQLIREQAIAALWLLCRFGGVGSKARKGFGSFQDINGLTLDECKQSAYRFRSACDLAERKLAEVHTPSLDHMLVYEDRIDTSDPWNAADSIGSSLQQFIKSVEKNDRLTLGLPRGKLCGPRGNRHASPVHFHLAQKNSDSLMLRVAAFPAPSLPNLQKSKGVLTLLLGHLRKTFGDCEELKPKKRRPGYRFEQDEWIITPDGEKARILEPVLLTATKMWVEFEDRAREEMPVADCKPLGYP